MANTDCDSMQTNLLRGMWDVPSLLLFVFALSLSLAGQAESQSLKDYAIKCDLETQITWEGFLCDDPNSTLVPMTNAFDKDNNPVSGSAWQHNVLNTGQVPVAPGTSPTSWYTTPENVQHVAYVGTDRLIHESFYFISPHADFVDLYSRVKRCDRPDRLNKDCDPGSRFHVIAKTQDAYVVAHCRKRGNPGNTWGDIAVIQHNTKNGATCFYQEGPNDGLSNDVKAPKNPGPNEWH